ncbi:MULTISPECIES: ABC transporter permease [unclassified Microbacterium]|uniref:ABC transporter permease n=1 Tax=unclassified Microbacterium TaxID=2609290 RepID=UPI0012FA87FA|nr:ABC transporter permease [Microbacterium sp. MAH-37]MVQ42040.1 ABC transporter permease [Microbacterium sp. MAH-37]
MNSSHPVPERPSSSSGPERAKRDEGRSGTERDEGPSLDELRAEAIAAARLPRRRGSWYVAEHIIRAMRAYGWTLVVGAVGQPVLYLVGLALGLAALIQAPIQDGSQQVGYVVFVAPALLMSAAITVASEEFSYPVMAGFKWRRFFYGFSASPLSSGQIVNGEVIGVSARVVLTAGLYYLFLLIFPAVGNPATSWLMILVGILAALAFGTPMLAYAASLEEDTGQFALVQRFVFMPMFLFSGTFYPLDSLPVWLQWIGWISPLWHATELGRDLSYPRDTDGVMVAVHLVVLLAFAVGGYLAARRIFARRLAA